MGQLIVFLAQITTDGIAIRLFERLEEQGDVFLGRIHGDGLFSLGLDKDSIVIIFICKEIHLFYLCFLGNKGRYVQTSDRNQVVLLQAIDHDILTLEISIGLMKAQSASCIIEGDIVAIDTFFFQG